MVTEKGDASFQVSVQPLNSSAPMYFLVLGTSNTCYVTRSYLGNSLLFPNTIPPGALGFWEELGVGKALWAREAVKKGGGRNGKV